jgi:thiosulfate/3-mercaptopyruvate sulfurtransferase
MTERMTEELRPAHLVETALLEAHLHDPGLRVVDMRGYVRTRNDPDGRQTAEYAGARQEYEAGHIPGAVYLDWTADITDPDDPIPAQVAPPERMASALGAAGIGNHTTVVAYDNHPASQFATRLWWALRYYGHDAVRVLNGGLAKWRAEGRPLTAGNILPPPAVFTPRTRPQLRATAEEVLASLNHSDVSLADARDAGQYAGAIRRGPRGGHIPGAIHLPREALMAEDGTFRTPEELRMAVEGAGIRPDRRVIAYCNGGVAATVVLFALSMLGYPSLANYDGSWNEWGQRKDLPVEQTG